MRSAYLVLVALAGAPLAAAAAEAHLTDQQTLGRRLFEQSCGVCHTRPTLVSRMYGPELSRETAAGQEEAVRVIIANGTARMPAFRHTYSPDQIAAIAAYLKTVPPGNQDVPSARAPDRSPTPAQ